MGDASVNISIADCLPYFEQRFLQIFGKDQESLDTAAWFKALQTTGMTLAAHVHCVGMQSPLPFDSIYQPTMLRMTRGHERATGGESYAYEDRASRSILIGKALEERSVTVEQFLLQGGDAIIFAGPGWGKTTFLHHIFRRFVRSEDVLPILITLRRPTALEDLERFVEVGSKIQRKHHKSRALLLVDGYDELAIEPRKRVSEALLRYQALGIGGFYLTCREYYDVYQLPVPQVRIGGFSLEDKRRFVRTFLASFNSPLNPDDVVNDFESRGFSEFLSHPLLLALACIVKTSPSSVQPRSALRLLERALDVLCYRLDEHKGIDRHRLTPLDGKDRIQVLKRIAYVAKTGHLPQARAEELARKQIDLLTFDKVDTRQVLMETAQFYGIFVPSDDGWEFVHRTLHDFLAAQYWVETGEFAKVISHEWNSRTAYAACRIPDATSILESALSCHDGLPAVAEILSNCPSFDMDRIATAIINYFSKSGRTLDVVSSDRMRVTGRLQTDFVRLAGSRFLNHLIEKCCEKRRTVTDLIAGYCIFETYSRRRKLDFVTYDKALSAYGSESFTFDLTGVGQVQLDFVNPKQSLTRLTKALEKIESRGI